MVKSWNLQIHTKTNITLQSFFYKFLQSLWTKWHFSLSLFLSLSEVVDDDDAKHTHAYIFRQYSREREKNLRENITVICSVLHWLGRKKVDMQVQGKSTRMQDTFCASYEAGAPKSFIFLILVWIFFPSLNLQWIHIIRAAIKWKRSKKRKK